MWWTVHLEGGPRRVNHAAVAVGNMILSFGGYCTGDNYKNKTPIDLFVLNPHTYRWKEVPKPRTDSAEAEDWPYQRYGHTVCSHNTDVYLFGGRNDESPCNAVYKFDTRTGTWSRPSVSGTVPPERDGHSACIIRDAMYVFGGYEESHSRYGQEVFMLDLTTMVWSLAATNGEQPIYRDFHSATAVGDKMFIFGGRSEMPGERENYSNKLSYLDTTTGTWHCPAIQPIVYGQSPVLPKGRRSHSAINYRGKLMIFGGYNSRLEEHMNDLWQLDSDTWTWTQLRPHGIGPIARRRQVMCLVGSRIYLFGGTSPYHGPPIDFTEEQKMMLPESNTEEQDSLIDHNDLYVLDLWPSLRTLCMITVIESQAASKARTEAEAETTEAAPLPPSILQDLPSVVRQEMRHMTLGNTISKPLPLRLG